MCDRVRPLDQVKGNLPPVEGEERAKKLYIRIPSLDDPRWGEDQAGAHHVSRHGTDGGQV